MKQVREKDWGGKKTNSQPSKLKSTARIEKTQPTRGKSLVPKKKTAELLRVGKKKLLDK